jgi:branched-chain amino acid transport system permease protein
MEYVVQQILNALSFGAEYSLLALGLAIVFSIMGLVNFAHGELVAIGGYMMYAMAAIAIQSLWWILPLAVLFTVIAAVLLERVAFRPVRRAPATTGLLTAFGVGLILQNIFLLTVSARPRAVPVLGPLNQTWSVGPFTVSSLQVMEMLTTGVAIALLLLFFKRTPIGVAMRAAAFDFATVRLMGVRANRVIATAFAVSGLLAGIAAIFIIARRGAVDPLLGFNPVLKAFVACVLGGFGSLPGAVIGGFALGAIEVLILVIMPQHWGGLRDAAVFGLVGALLVWRPQGLVGKTIELGDKEA